MKAPPTAREIVAAAKRAGLIAEGYLPEIVAKYSDDEIIEIYRLPDEVGLQAIHPAPRKRARNPNPRPSRYVISPKQAKAMGYKLPRL